MVPNKRVFDGIKVADFSWSIVGPLATRCLADYGATVIKVESIEHPDMGRRMAPYVNGKSGVERSALFAMYNTNKLSMALNLSHPAAIEIARELVTWSDVVVETFRPQVMEKLGLDYDTLKKLRPDIIMARSSLQGETGPRSLQTGYGTMMQSLAGFINIVGWPDRSPVSIAMPLADFIAAYYLTIAILAALEYRDRTGRGQLIDLSQLEASTTFVAPATLDYAVNGHEFSANGNRHPFAAPHGAFRCQGDDRWCALAVFTDAQWEAFKQVIGLPEWTNEPKFATFMGRKENENELERLIENWTSSLQAEEVMAKLQAAGVPAGVAKNGQDLCEDIQLAHRHYFEWLEHPVVGMLAINSYPFHISNITYHMESAPQLGEHTEYVCREILGMSDEEFIKYLQKGIFE